MEGRPHKNLVLILAREFASNLATPTLIADADGRLIFYNESAEPILGRPFAEAGEMSAHEWSSLFSTEELDGTPLPLERMPAGAAMFEHRPAHRSFRITGLDGAVREIAATAFPLFALDDEFVGVFAIFWESSDTEAL